MCMCEIANKVKKILLYYSLIDATMLCLFMKLNLRDILQGKYLGICKILNQPFDKM